MSILSKLQSLLSAANTATGESDTTLTDAMQTLIDGYGQGGSGGELLVDNVATEDVATINLVIPEGKRSYRVYVVELVGRTSSNEWVYPRFNITTPATSGAYLPQKQTYNSKFVVAKYAYGQAGYTLTTAASGNSSLIGTSSSTLNNIFLNLYNASSVFKAGFEAKVWGYDI